MSAMRCTAVDGPEVGKVAQAHRGEVLVGKAGHVRSEAGRVAAVLQDAQPAVLTDELPRAVGDARAVIERSGRIHDLEEARTADSSGVEIRIPREEILDRREDAAVAHRLRRGHGDAPAAAFCRRIRERAPWMLAEASSTTRVLVIPSGTKKFSRMNWANGLPEARFTTSASRK
jgi:hypothetical protein